MVYFRELLISLVIDRLVSKRPEKLTRKTMVSLLHMSGLAYMLSDLFSVHVSRYLQVQYLELLSGCKATTIVPIITTEKMTWTDHGGL
jgi:hypothetical protein